MIDRVSCIIPISFSPWWLLSTFMSADVTLFLFNYDLRFYLSALLRAVFDADIAQELKIYFYYLHSCFVLLHLLG
jgi:hypothetical protein